MHQGPAKHTIAWQLVSGLLLLSGCLTSFEPDLLRDAGPSTDAAADAPPDGFVASCERRDDGTPCAGGRCRNEACCTGCWDGVSCLDGTAGSACGGGGEPCTVCRAPTDTCREGLCGPARVVAEVDAGRLTTCVVTTEGDLLCWGNTSGVLPEGGVTPQPIAPGERFRDVAVSEIHEQHACAIRENGQLACWGNSADGRLGLGAGVDADVPTNVTFADRPDPDVRAVGCVAAGTVAVLGDGSRWGWGLNSGDRLGLPGVGGSAEPVLGESDIDYRILSVGGAFGCAVDAGGALRCWGQAGEGRTGLDADAASPTPVGTSYETVGAGLGHSCAIRAGRLYCFGSNADGQLGVPGASGGSTPVEVEPTGQWTQVAGGRWHTCAIRGDAGTLYCWGTDTEGQIGVGGERGMRYDAPERVGDAYADIAAGYEHTCAIRRNGLLECWGDGGHRQVGSMEDQFSPMAVPLPPR